MVNDTWNHAVTIPHDFGSHQSSQWRGGEGSVWDVLTNALQRASFAPKQHLSSLLEILKTYSVTYRTEGDLLFFREDSIGPYSW